MIKIQHTIVLLALISCLCLSACRQDSGTFTDGPSANPAAPVIGQLKTRDKLITVRIGQDGPLYKVTSNEGVVLAEDLPEKELVAKFPELKQVIERGMADWADLDLRHQGTPGPVEL
jgi:hypothetical protein